jgi:integrase
LSHARRARWARCARSCSYPCSYRDRGARRPGHPEIADRLEATLGPREDRDPEARLFADSGADALRTAIAKACKAAAIPTFSPHDLRHRRISLMHLRGVPWARIGEFVGQRNLAVAANTYSHVLVDEAEVEYAALP